MPYWALIFLFGIVTLTTFKQLPSLYYSLLIIPTLISYLILAKTKFFVLEITFKTLVVYLMGFIWALLNAHWQLYQRIPSSWDNKLVKICGNVYGIPEIHRFATQFIFQVDSIEDKDIRSFHAKWLRLSWYGKAHLQVGQYGCLQVRLKAIHNHFTPGSFDYEGWLLQQGIHGTGYVVNSSYNHFFTNQNSFISFNSIRQRCYLYILNALKYNPFKGFISALIVGVRNEITEEQWLILQRTGTNHLMAIAGLHVGFVVSFTYFLMTKLWRWELGLLFIPAPQIACALSLVTALIYSAMAGFAIPTQRAAIMLAVMLITQLLRMTIPRWQSWSLALVIILFLNPLIVLSDSFWLSFIAVAMIIYGMSANLNQFSTKTHWLRIQWVVSCGLLPLTLLFFHQVAWHGILANFIAIPWVGFVVLPLSIMGTLVGLFMPLLGKCLLILAGFSMEIIWCFLKWLANMPNLQWHYYLADYRLILASFIAVILLLAPRGTPGRWLALIWLIPLFTWQPMKPAFEQLWISFLDIKHGMLAVVQTTKHTLVLTNKNQLTNDDKHILLSYLNYSQIKHVDKLIIQDLTHSIANVSELFNNNVFHPTFYSDDLSALQKTEIINSKTKQDIWLWESAKFSLIKDKLKYDSNNLIDKYCILKINIGSEEVCFIGKNNKIKLHHLVKTYSPQIIILNDQMSKSTTDTILFKKILAYVVSINNKTEQLAAGGQNNQLFKILNIMGNGTITIQLNNMSRGVSIKRYASMVKKFWNQ